MDGDRYRSYVIRAWTRGLGTRTRARVRIERVESGEQVDIEGSDATRLAASLEAAIRSVSAALVPEPSPTGSTEEPEPTRDMPSDAPSGAPSTP